MKLEEELIKLNEEEIFGREKVVEIEKSEVIKNMRELISLIEEIMNINGLDNEGTIFVGKTLLLP